jgi:hypothetical protein
MSKTLWDTATHQYQRVLVPPVRITLSRVQVSDGDIVIGSEAEHLRRHGFFIWFFEVGA